MEHYDILIATPGAKLEAQYVQSLVKTLEECSKRGISYKWLNGYSSLVHHARELTATGGDGFTLNPNHSGPLGDSVTYNKIIWIDSDIAWTPNDFFKLYESKNEIISGAYLLANGIASSIHTKEYPGGMPKDVVLSTENIIDVEGVGFGFIAISSGVFEQIPRPWFAHLQQIVPTDNGKQVVDSVGEDISWCAKAKSVGFKIYFDPEVLVTHMKTAKIIW